MSLRVGFDDIFLIAMLEIRPEQRDSFRNEVYSAFVLRLDDFLKSEVPQQFEMPREDRLQLIDALLCVAAAYGLETEQHATLYVLAAWLCGFDFEEQHPQVAALLRSGDYSPDEKSEWLTAWLENQALERQRLAAHRFEEIVDNHAE